MWKERSHKSFFRMLCIETNSSESAFSGRTLPTLTFLYFYFFFMSKCIPRNQLNQAETQNSNERQIAVGASKPNLVDVFVLKKSRTLWGWIGSSSDKSSQFYTGSKDQQTIVTAQFESEAKQRTTTTTNNSLHARISWGDTGRPIGARPNPINDQTSTHASANKTNNKFLSK